MLPLEQSLGLQAKVAVKPLLGLRHKLSLKCLSLPAIEVSAFMQKEIDDNPFLEIFSETQKSRRSVLKNKELLPCLSLEENTQTQNESGRPVEPSETLEEHLLVQLEFMRLDTERFRIAQEIVESLEPDGYLRISLEEIAQTLGVTLGGVQTALEIVQRLDPSGIASRDLRECLMNQLILDGKRETLAFKILNLHFELLKKKRFEALKRLCRVSRDRIQEAIRVIYELEPKPAREFWKQKPNSVIEPDVIVQPTEDGFKVVLFRQWNEHVRTSSSYLNLLKDNDLNPEARNFLEQKRQKALLLLRALKERGETLLKVGQYIVNYQKEFLETGSGWQPLTLKDLSRELNLHVSTISRALSNKYIKTPRGLFELKSFLSLASQKSIKQTLAELVAQENPQEPLSDQKLQEILAQRGLGVARRTIAKYREALKILPSHLRRTAALTS